MFSIIISFLPEKDFYQPVERSHIEEKINSTKSYLFISLAPSPVIES